MGGGEMIRPGYDPPFRRKKYEVVVGYPGAIGLDPY